MWISSQIIQASLASGTPIPVFDYGHCLQIMYINFNNLVETVFVTLINYIFAF